MRKLFAFLSSLVIAVVLLAVIPGCSASDKSSDPDAPAASANAGEWKIGEIADLSTGERTPFPPEAAWTGHLSISKSGTGTLKMWETVVPITWEASTQERLEDKSYGPRWMCYYWFYAQDGSLLANVSLIHCPSAPVYDALGVTPFPDDLDWSSLWLFARE